MRSRAGLTLIEVLIALALFAALAAVAIPRMEEARKRTRRAEMQTNVRTIRTALEATTFAKYGPTFGGAGPAPRADEELDERAVPWVTDPGFDFIGFAPEGKVRCNYIVNVDNPNDIYVRARCDVDDDDVFSEVLMTATEFPYLVTPNEIY